MLDSHIAENMANIIIDIAEQAQEISEAINKVMIKLNDLETRVESLEKRNV